MSQDERYDIIIIGGGPNGMTVFNIKLPRVLS